MFEIQIGKASPNKSFKKRLEELEELLEKYTGNPPIQQAILHEIKEVFKLLQLK
ncbi:MAG: hypothetical protein N3A69_02975 [Leptospiraceae bacterium]|nr:hypothetical protein [Leptospiraceae bacterium]